MLGSKNPKIPAKPYCSAGHCCGRYRKRDVWRLDGILLVLSVSVLPREQVGYILAFLPSQMVTCTLASQPSLTDSDEAGTVLRSWRPCEVDLP